MREEKYFWKHALFISVSMIAFVFLSTSTTAFLNAVWIESVLVFNRYKKTTFFHGLRLQNLSDKTKTVLSFERTLFPKDFAISPERMDFLPWFLTISVHGKKCTIFVECLQWKLFMLSFYNDLNKLLNCRATENGTNSFRGWMWWRHTASFCFHNNPLFESRFLCSKKIEWVFQGWPSVNTWNL